MNSNSTCPLCGVEALVEQKYSRTLTLDKHEYLVDGLRRSKCSACGEQSISPDQSRHNKRAIAAAKDEAVVQRDTAERLTPALVLETRKELGLTQAQAARVFGGGANAFSKYENGEIAPTEAMSRLLRLSREIPQAREWLLRRAGMQHLLAPSERGELTIKLDQVSKNLARVLKALRTASLAPHTARHSPTPVSFTFSAANDAEVDVRVQQYG